MEDCTDIKELEKLPGWEDCRQSCGDNEENVVFELGRLEGKLLLADLEQPLKDGEVFCDTCEMTVYDENGRVSFVPGPVHAIPEIIKHDFDLQNAFCSGVHSVMPRDAEDEDVAA